MNAEPYKMSVLYFGASFLPRLRTLPREQVQRLANEAGEESNRQPLWLCHEREFVLPAWDPAQKLSGCQVIALMVFSVWILCGENEQHAAPLVAAWPIKEACALCPLPKPT